MAIKPENQYIQLSLSGTTATLYCENIEDTPLTIEFDRPEYDHQKQKTAPENTGIEPILGVNIGGVPFQIQFDAISSTLRDPRPNDTDLDNKFKKFYGTRYTLNGNTSLNFDSTTVKTWAGQHQFLIDRFSAHQKFAGDAVSIQELLSLQSETFGFLTTTGLTFTSQAVGSVSNVLIRSFSLDVDYYIPDSGLTLYTWKAVLDSLTLYNLSATS